MVNFSSPSSANSFPRAEHSTSLHGNWVPFAVAWVELPCFEISVLCIHCTRLPETSEPICWQPGWPCTPHPPATAAWRGFACRPALNCLCRAVWHAINLCIAFEFRYYLEAAMHSMALAQVRGLSVAATAPLAIKVINKCLISSQNMLCAISEYF